MRMGEDLYESFVRYQKWLLAEFDKTVESYGFEIVDASNSVEEVFENYHGMQRHLRIRCCSGFPVGPGLLYFGSFLANVCHLAIIAQAFLFQLCQ